MGTFGEWLRGQRMERKLTREEFAARVGCSVAMLRKIEDGERRPSAQIAELIANCLDVPFEERDLFTKAARGELSMERFTRVSKRISHPETSPSHPVSRPKLPSVPTPLIGRQHEVGELGTLLKDPQCRLLTVVGPGGIGKTRLSIETASQCQSDFTDGVYFVALASVQAFPFMVPVFADSLGFVFHSDTIMDPKSQLLNYLGEKQILFLVDNLEHLIADSAVVDFFAELLQCATNVKLLVTSRESLGLQGEWVFEVHGLPLPENAEVEGTSVELFLQRARRAHVGFDATMADYPAIIRICKLVNGMPLGIELAASWVRTLSCDEIAREIERGLDFLSVSAKDLPARHRSMRAVFDHSWKLLSEEEQNVLLRLSVFQGGFSREAAQQVADATLPLLSTLVTKSLVRRSGAGRYDLHELIRQYAFEQSENQPKIHKAVKAQHGRYFMGFLRQQDLRLRSSVQQEALAQLLADIDNIRSGLEWALAQKEFLLIEPALRAYSTFFDTLGWSQEALDYLGRARDVLESNPSRSKEEQAALAHVLTSRALFAFRVGQNEQAHKMLEQSLEILHSLHEPHILVEALTFLGIVKYITGDLSGALVLFQDGLQTAREIDDPWYAALCLTEVVAIYMWMGKLENIHEQFQAAVDAWRKTGDQRFTAFGLNSLSMGAIAVGKYDEAYAALEESIAINTSIGDRWGLGSAYIGLGLAAQAQGKHQQALDSFQNSLQIFTELGSRWEMARVCSDMGWSSIALGHDLEAERLWHEVLKLSQETHGVHMTMEALVGIANIQAKRGNNKNALQLLLVSSPHSAMIPKTKAQAEILATALKERLSPEEIESVQSYAEKTTLDSVVRELTSKLR